MDLTTWLLYLAVAIGLSLSPGPNGLLALTHCALLKSSIVWLTVLKWVGAAYLVLLGIQVWRAPPIDLGPSRGVAVVSGAGLVRQGALSAVTNPKGLLFFAAFPPQFVDPARSLWVQFVVMAGTFAVVEIVTEWALAGTGLRLRPWLKRVGTRFNRVCGGVLMALGAALPLRG